jgi:hypothetical protein
VNVSHYLTILFCTIIRHSPVKCTFSAMGYIPTVVKQRHHEKKRQIQKKAVHQHNNNMVLVVYGVEEIVDDSV